MTAEGGLGLSGQGRALREAVSMGSRNPSRGDAAHRNTRSRRDPAPRDTRSPLLHPARSSEPSRGTGPGDASSKRSPPSSISAPRPGTSPAQRIPRRMIARVGLERDVSLPAAPQQGWLWKTPLEEENIAVVPSPTLFPLFWLFVIFV